MTPQHLRQIADRTGLDSVAEALREGANTIEQHEATIARRDAVIKLLEGEVAQAHETRKQAQAQLEAQQPATGEPVAWVVMNGVSKYQVCGAKAPADALCSEMQKRHDLSGSLAAFHVQPLYTNPAPSVPADVVRDAERYRWLADCNNYEAGLALIIDPKLTEHALGEAIDAAMLAAK